MNDSAVWLAVTVDGDREVMTLDRYREENSAVGRWVDLAAGLKLGDRFECVNGLTVERIAAPPRPLKTRWVRMSLPWEFDGSKVVTVSIHRDNGTVSFRPRGRRRVTHVDLGKLLEVVASREAKAAAIAKRKARRSRK